MGKDTTTVLVTGAAGLIGSRFVDWLVSTRPEITIIGIDDLSGGYIENVNKLLLDNGRFYKMNAGDKEVADIFKKHRPDIVYHMSAYAAEGTSPFIRKFNYTNNLVVTANIVNNCIAYDIKRLVFTSSMAVYGKGNPPFRESDTPSPIDPYGIAKAACEADIKVAGDHHKLDWCIIRPHNVYGIKQNIWDVYRNVLGIWLYNVFHNLPITIYGDGLQTRAFTYIDDILPCLWKAGTEERCSKQIFNLGGIKEVTILEAAQLVKKITGEKVDIVHLPARYEVKHAFSTWQKSVEYLGFKHVTSLEDGLKKMWEWAKQQPSRERFVWTEYELDKGIYDYWKQENIKK